MKFSLRFYTDYNSFDLAWEVTCQRIHSVKLYDLKASLYCEVKALSPSSWTAAGIYGRETLQINIYPNLNSCDAYIHSLEFVIVGRAVNLQACKS